MKKEEIYYDKIKFLKEQVGAPEEVFKRHLVDLFMNNTKLHRAYLVSVQYDSRKDFNVALCLRAEDTVSAELMNSINTLFAKMFLTKEHLDVLLLNDEKEARLITVCKPFYEKSDSLG